MTRRTETIVSYLCVDIIIVYNYAIQLMLLLDVLDCDFDVRCWFGMVHFCSFIAMCCEQMNKKWAQIVFGVTVSLYQWVFWKTLSGRALDMQTFLSHTCRACTRKHYNKLTRNVRNTPFCLPSHIQTTQRPPFAATNECPHPVVRWFLSYLHWIRSFSAIWFDLNCVSKNQCRPNAFSMIIFAILYALKRELAFIQSTIFFSPFDDIHL